MVTRPKRHVPPIVELCPLGSSAHAVRGQMSLRHPARVATRQLSASDLDTLKQIGRGEKANFRCILLNKSTSPRERWECSLERVHSLCFRQFRCRLVMLWVVNGTVRRQYVPLWWRKVTTENSLFVLTKYKIHCKVTNRAFCC